MNTLRPFFAAILLLVVLPYTGSSQDYLHETKADRDARMSWWREARFGLFIHWGLYAVPAGEWNGKTDYGEWIRTSAEIPLEEYDTFVKKFNPVRFDPGAWVRSAKNAGMKYIVITSKHHDGFCLFDSRYTDFDVMSTPYGKDILRALAQACRQEGMKLCFYHSIMDWHHPDYLPRRGWEKNRPAGGAVFRRYVDHLKAQLKELLTNYGDIGVLWFDGEWESTWNRSYGKELYNYVRSLQPSIIVNNRVGSGRSGMEGFTKEGEFAGDFGTPEQEIPATGLPGFDWETCMTMNDHWGYNKNDDRWKSSKDLVRMLTDVASKGGNYLLNVGPTAEGLFPEASMQRLGEIGRWMTINGEAIHGTTASPFKELAWGRCTQKKIDGGTRLYLHVFDWPSSGKLVVPGILNLPLRACLLSDSARKPMNVDRLEDALIIDLPRTAPDTVNSVVALDIAGLPDINDPPMIASEAPVFVDSLGVTISSSRENVELRYTLDGSSPTVTSPIVAGPLMLSGSTKISARCFRNGLPVSGSAYKFFEKVDPRPALRMTDLDPGLRYSYYEGDWDSLPDFDRLSPVKSGIVPGFSFSPRNDSDHFGFSYTGFLKLPADGVYTFCTESDDGSQLYVDGTLIVDNNGLHPMMQREGVVPLAAGLHGIRVVFFEKTGDDGLLISYRSRDGKRQPVSETQLFHSR